MLKLLFTILAAVLITILAMDNMQRVELGLIVGRPVHVRLFFLLLTSFLLGCIMTMLFNLYRSTVIKKKRDLVQKSEEEDFFLD